MKRNTGRLALGLCVGVLFWTWTARTESLAAAQERKSIKVTRIYTGPDGQSHAEETELKLTERGIAEFSAKGVQFSSRPAGPPNTNWHTGPRRQFVITLSGRAELEVADGQKVLVGPGHINLIEDTTGKGHLTRNLEDRVVLTIPIDDQPGAAAMFEETGRGVDRATSSKAGAVSTRVR